MTLAADMHRALGVAETVIIDSTIRAHWFKTPNPALGNRSPRGLIRTGEVERVIALLQGSDIGRTGPTKENQHDTHLLNSTA